MNYGPRTPTLLYDGECLFCRTWVDYWQRCTDGVLYETVQDAGDAHPGIAREQQLRAVHFVDENGKVTAGAAAVFSLLARAPGKKWLLWAYEHLRPFAWASEQAYALIAAHRPWAMAVTRVLWGRRIEKPSFAVGRWLFTRSVGVIYLIAFISFAVQLSGLIGGAGILPASTFLAAASDRYGAAAFWLYPTMAWFGASDAALQVMTMVGAASAIAVISGFAVLPALAVAYVCMLSLVTVGQDFFAYQWDVLLLEMGFLAILVVPTGLGRDAAAKEPSAAARWLLWLLLFRVTWGSGLVKMYSGDTSWRTLTALSYHYFTQPLPNPLSWTMQWTSAGFQKLQTLSALLIELAVPFLLFAPRRLRMAGAAVTVAFHLLIAATGNFAFYNLEVMALCLTCFDDQWYRWAFRKKKMPVPVPENAKAKPPLRVLAGAGLSLLFAADAVLLSSAAAGRFYPRGIVGAALGAAAPLRLANVYGAFAVMTTERREVVIEGSEDGQNWKEYGFRHKPGDVLRQPGWVAPHDPRLDWQMWFLPFGEWQEHQWFVSLLMRLLQGTPEVTSLLAQNPFPDYPPRYVRALLYDYRFTTREERMVDGAWWHRELIGEYAPLMSLQTMADVFRSASRGR